MPDTGERDYINLMPENLAEWYMHLMHIASYEYASRFAEGKKVFDYGCGSGYGSACLASVASSVLGADISTEAIDYAREHYIQKGLEFMNISILQQQCEVYDLITSFQVIEHVKRRDEYLKTIKERLVPGGLALISTPNRENRLFRFQRPWNIYHLVEYSPESLRKLLLQYFESVDILYISSLPELITAEIIRTRKLRKYTLPATLPFYPEFLRTALLKMQSNMASAVKNLINHHSVSTSVGKQPTVFPYTSSDIIISPEAVISSDLIAVCR